MKHLLLGLILLLGPHSFAESEIQGSVDNPSDNNAEMTVTITVDEQGLLPGKSRDINSKRARLALARKALKICKAVGAHKFKLTNIETPNLGHGDLSCFVENSDGSLRFLPIPESALK